MENRKDQTGIMARCTTISIRNTVTAIDISQRTYCVVKYMQNSLIELPILQIWRDLPVIPETCSGGARMLAMLFRLDLRELFLQSFTNSSSVAVGKQIRYVVLA